MQSSSQNLAETFLTVFPGTNPAQVDSMPTKEKSITELLAENDDLRLRLDEAEETLRAVWSGEVDALVVSGSENNQIHTLKGSDKPYRVLVEAMNEGAVTLGGDGTILYCNNRFAEMVKVPLQQVIGSSIHRFVAPTDGDKVTRLPALRKGGPCEQEIAIMAVDGTLIPSHFSAAPLVMGNLTCICAVVTDLTEINKTREALRKASYDLKGRLKELKCLYSFAEIARRQDLSLDQDRKSVV